MQSSSFQAAMWLSMALYLPLSLLFWHAPGWCTGTGAARQEPVLLPGGLRAQYGRFPCLWAGLAGVFALGGLVISLLAGLLGARWARSVASWWGWRWSATMLFGSIVFTFRDCFRAPGRSAERPDDEERPAPSPRPGLP